MDVALADEERLSMKHRSPCASKYIVLLDTEKNLLLKTLLDLTISILAASVLLFLEPFYL